MGLEKLGGFSFSEVSSQIYETRQTNRKTGVRAKLQALFSTIKQLVGAESKSAARALQELSDSKPSVIEDTSLKDRKIGDPDEDEEEPTFYGGELLSKLGPTTETNEDDDSFLDQVLNGDEDSTTTPEGQETSGTEDAEPEPTPPQADQPEAGEIPSPEEGSSPSPEEDSPSPSSSLPEDQGAPEAPSSSPKAPAPDSLAGLSSSSAKAPLAAAQIPKRQPGDPNPAAGGENPQDKVDLFSQLQHVRIIPQKPPEPNARPQTAAIPPRPESGDAGKVAAGKPRLSQAELRKMFQQAMQESFQKAHDGSGKDVPKSGD
jgi:hypothetical protein